MKFKQYINEATESAIFGRNQKQKRIYDRLSGATAKEYINTVKTKHDAYDKIFNALKRGSKGQNLGKMSTTQGYRDTINKIVIEIEKAMPNTFSKTHFSSLSKKTVSLKGFGSFPLSDNFDIADYLSSVVLKLKNMTNPDDHKAWFKK